MFQTTNQLPCLLLRHAKGEGLFHVMLKTICFWGSSPPLVTMASTTSLWRRLVVVWNVFLILDADWIWITLSWCQFCLMVSDILMFYNLAGGFNLPENILPIAWIILPTTIVFSWFFNQSASFFHLPTLLWNVHSNCRSFIHPFVHQSSFPKKIKSHWSTTNLTKKLDVLIIHH